MKAIVGGASGFTGEKLLKRLIADQECTDVYALVRKKLPVKASKLHQLIVNY